MSILGSVREEVRISRERDPAIHSYPEVFPYPGLKVMIDIA